MVKGPGIAWASSCRAMSIINMPSFFGKYQKTVAENTAYAISADTVFTDKKKNMFMVVFHHRINHHSIAFRQMR